MAQFYTEYIQLLSRELTNDLVLRYRFEGEGLSESPTVACTRFQVHDKFQTILQAYDKEMLSKLDLRRKSDNRTPPNYTRSAFTASAQGSSPTIDISHRQRTQLRPISIPNLSATEPICSEYFPASSPHSQTLVPLDSKSPFDSRDLDQSISLNHRLSRNGYHGNSDELNYNNKSHIFPEQIPSWEREEESQEETGIKRLDINEYSSRAGFYSPCTASGKKRRASSAIENDSSSLHAVGSSYDLKRRESLTSRNSAGPRYHSQSGSISSNTSDTRNNSYTSSLSVAASSITSMGSLGRLSPSGISPRCIDGTESPCTTSQSLNPSPRGSLPRPSYQRRISSDNRLLVLPARQLPDLVSHSQQSRPISNLNGVYICECCPKKPKKFDTLENL